MGGSNTLPESLVALGSSDISKALESRHRSLQLPHQ